MTLAESQETEKEDEIKFHPRVRMGGPDAEHLPLL